MLDSFKTIPVAHTLDHLLYIEGNGVTAAVEHWGDLMLRRYGKERQAMYAPFETRYLGYASDNGGFYYYNPLPNQTYEATFLAVQRDYEQLHIPFRHMELDSFCKHSSTHICDLLFDLLLPLTRFILCLLCVGYYKAAGGGVVNWTAMPSAFPNGLVAFHEKVQLNVTAHNRWWAPAPSYAKQYGGQYDWIIEAQHSVPNDPHFWPDLFRNASAWGLRVYLQDWLGTEFADVVALHSEVGLARQWLMQMGEGAWGAGHMIIQYCGPHIRHILQSVEVEAVRQSRASGDYEPGNTRWNNWDIRSSSKPSHLPPILAPPLVSILTAL